MRLLFTVLTLMQYHYVLALTSFSRMSVSAQNLDWKQNMLSLIYKNISFSDFGDLSLASFCRSSAEKPSHSVESETGGAEIKARHRNKSPIDFVHSSRPRSRPRQGKVKIKTGLET